VLRIPGSFGYFAHRDTDTGRTPARLLGRFVAAALALPDQMARESGRDHARANPLADILSDTLADALCGALADALIDTAFERGFVGKTRAPLDPAPRQGSGMVPDASRSLVAAFDPTDRDDRATRARKAAERRTVLGWTRYFLIAQTCTANQMPLPGWRRWQPPLRVVPNPRDELARRVLPGYQNRLDARQRRERPAWLHEHGGGRKARFSQVESLSR
jgi:hypothetical protein